MKLSAVAPNCLHKRVCTTPCALAGYRAFAAYCKTLTVFINTNKRSQKQPIK